MPILQKYVIPFILLMLITVSCDPNRVYEDYKGVDDKGWIPRDQVQFDVVIKDTLKLYNLYINVRNTNDYPYSNIYFFVHTRFPDGTLYTDTVEYLLAEPSGKWVGKGPGKIKDNQFAFRRGVDFPHSGIYTIRVEHAMREDYLIGIHDIGLRVELF